MKHSLWLILAVAVGCSAATQAPEGSVSPGEDAGVDSEPPPINTTGFELTKGLAIAEIAMFQGPKVTLEKAGARVDMRRAPVVAGREGMLRVYVTPDADWAAREVVATLTLDGSTGKKTRTEKKTITIASTDDNLDSTFNFNFAADEIAPDTTFSVSLKTEGAQTSAGGTDNAQYPADGSADSLGAQGTGEMLRVKIVPVKYNADGSGRLPDTSEGQIELYRKGFAKLYPARKVEITVREPFNWSTTISRTGSGFSSLLQAIVRLRQTDGAERGVYYYGAFAPGASFYAWCQGACVAGLSPLAQNPSDTWTAASIGLGFSGESSVGTAVHEVGHGHGRGHSPCAPGGGIDGVDPRYPYSGAALGVWAWDIESKVLVAPTKAKDFMGYCDPTFVSDYTFGALATRMAFVYGATFEIGAEARSYRVLTVAEDGELAGGDEVVTARAPSGEPRTVALDLGGGKRVPVTAAYYPWDHLPGGLLVVPVGAASVRAIEARDLVPGRVSTLSLAR